MKGRTVVVHDKMQKGYRYRLTAPVGREFDPQFTPDLTPKEVLRLGVFAGKYLTDCRRWLPSDWFAKAKLATGPRDRRLNCFGVEASQTLPVWRARGWIHPCDPPGWFQWYCRHYQGRRMPAEDRRQIARWKAIRRHMRQIERNCKPDDLSCRRRQRQALLHWAYDARRI